MRLHVSLASILVSAALPAFVACGSSSDGGGSGQPANTSPTPTAGDDGGSGSGQSGGGSDAGSTTPPDSGTTVDPNYPASHSPLPQVDFNGGRVLTAPKIVTVTFSGDALESRLQQFGDVITTTPWWTAVSSEYCSPEKGTSCIGKGTSGGHVVLNETPKPSYKDVQGSGQSDIQDFIQAHVTDGSFPEPTDQTIYVIYFPKGVSITLQSPDGSMESCPQTGSGFGGYHQGMHVTPKSGGSAVFAPYAIIPRCGAEQITTVSASHEIIETATDPDVDYGPGYYMTHSPWASLTGGEVGDVCADITGSGADQTTESGFTVQRSWSNKSAKASHDPCVPIPSGEIYFNAAPNQDDVTLSPGTSKTLDVTAFSDGPTKDWSLSVVDIAQLQGAKSDIQATLDKKTVNNGVKAQLTIKASATFSQQTMLFLVSNGGGARHFWPIALSTP